MALLKNPADPSKKATPRPELRGEYPDAGTVSQLVALIKHVCNVEAHPDLPVSVRQMKGVRQPYIQWIVRGQLIHVGETAPKAAAKEKVGVHGSILVGVGSTG
jgi:hypothetical protein